MELKHLPTVAAALLSLVMVPANPALATDSVPVPDDGVITSPGAYHLAKDLSVDRSTGIEIKADRVTLDLRGHALRFTGTPKPGVLGITASGRSDVRITNGAIGGFWFNVQCTQTDRLRIQNVRFDDIPYLAVNVGRSKGVVISDNEFSNFRYDLEKPKGSTYVIGVNLSSDDVVVTNNRFTAQPPAGTGPKLAMETVFVLFRPSKNCVVAHNEMIASELLHRGYGIWVATDASATIVYNRVRNTQYGVCVAGDGSATVGHNTFTIDETKDGATTMDTYGLAATAPKQIAEIGNTFTGFKIPTAIGKPATAPTTAPK